MQQPLVQRVGLPGRVAKPLISGLDGAASAALQDDLADIAHQPEPLASSDLRLFDERGHHRLRRVDEVLAPQPDEAD